ncbi:MAG: hypothetical protein Q9175_007158 [Cornicularia normoerica]
MPSLLDLPNEILTPIVDLVHVEDTRDVTVAALAECRDTILAKIEACPYIERQKQQIWTGAIFGGKESTVAALLILYLPNRRSITISNSVGNLGCLRQLISSIATANQTHTQSSHTPLSKLSHFRLQRRNTRDDILDTSLPRWLPNVAGLPSLRRLSGEAVTGHCSNRSNPCSGTELTDISFTNSDIDVKIFKYLLFRIKALQTFKYSYEGAPHNRASWEPRNIVQLLQTHAAHSLEILHLTRLSRNGPNNVKLDATFVDCLSGFRALKQVRLDHGMFVENPSMPTLKATKT